MPGKGTPWLCVALYQVFPPNDEEPEPSMQILARASVPLHCTTPVFLEDIPLSIDESDPEPRIVGTVQIEKAPTPMCAVVPADEEGMANFERQMADFVAQQKVTFGEQKFLYDDFRYLRIFEVAVQRGRIPLEMFYVVNDLRYSRDWLVGRLNEALATVSLHHSGRHLSPAELEAAFSKNTTENWNTLSRILMVMFTQFTPSWFYAQDRQVREGAPHPTDIFSAEYELGTGDCDDLSLFIYMALRRFIYGSLVGEGVTMHRLRVLRAIASSYIPVCILGRARNVGGSDLACAGGQGEWDEDEEEAFEGDAPGEGGKAFYHQHGLAIDAAALLASAGGALETYQKYVRSFHGSVTDAEQWYAPPKGRRLVYVLEGTAPTVVDPRECVSPYPMGTAKWWQGVGTGLAPGSKENIPSGADIYLGSFLLFTDALIRAGLADTTRFFITDAETGVTGVHEGTRILRGGLEGVKLVPAGTGLGSLLVSFNTFYAPFQRPPPLLTPCDQHAIPLLLTDVGIGLPPGALSLHSVLLLVDDDATSLKDEGVRSVYKRFNDICEFPPHTQVTVIRLNRHKRLTLLVPYVLGEV